MIVVSWGDCDWSCSMSFSFASSSSICFLRSSMFALGRSSSLACLVRFVSSLSDRTMYRLLVSGDVCVFVCGEEGLGGLDKL